MVPTDVNELFITDGARVVVLRTGAPEMEYTPNVLSMLPTKLVPPVEVVASTLLTFVVSNGMDAAILASDRLYAWVIDCATAVTYRNVAIRVIQ
jgi:hypothetical protein